MKSQKTQTKPAYRRIQHFLQRPLGDQWLFAQAYILLGLARLAILTVRFEPLARKLGKLGAESNFSLSDHELQQAKRVAWAIQRASSLTPWQSNCFPQAIAAKIILRQRNIESTLYLGAALNKSQSQGLQAHAWLRCGPLLVTGGVGHKNYAVVAKFS